MTPGVPAFLHPLPANAPPTRLTFAQWLVDRNSPTTARALVNRLWQSYFGIGLVSTSENFGKQSEPPSHPELLDWLAVEFMDRGWSLKATHRLMVTSATYRQSSHVTPDLLTRDPYNRLLARGPRMRVEAEIVRDIALAASGLLSPKVGGPSVYPPAPEFLVCAAGELRSQELVRGKGREPLPSGSLHLPLPLGALSDAPDIRCPQRRQLLCSPLPIQHPAAGVDDTSMSLCSWRPLRRWPVERFSEGGSNGRPTAELCFPSLLGQNADGTGSGRPAGATGQTETPPGGGMDQSLGLGGIQTGTTVAAAAGNHAGSGCRLDRSFAGAVEFG